MTPTPEAVPAWPLWTITTRDDTTVDITGPGGPTPARAPTRQAALAAVAERAREIGRAVRVDAVDLDGTRQPLIVPPEGPPTEAGPAVPPPGAGRRRLFKGRRGREAAPRPDSAPPAPPSDVVRRATVARIRAASDDDDHSLARALVKSLVADHQGHPARLLLAQEVHAYVELRAGKVGAAISLYLAAADLAATHTTTAHARTLVDNAHHCWLRATRADATSLGGALFSARVRVDGPDAKSTRITEEQICARTGVTACA